MTEADGVLSVCQSFFDAIERGDIAAVSEIYAPNAVIWHNTDQLETTREDNLKLLDRVVRTLSDRRYTNRRVNFFPGGFVQQHVLVGRVEGGRDLRLPACIVCSVADGHITRLDEYLDQLSVDRAFTGNSEDSED